LLPADRHLIAGNALTATNLYAYANGNPVMLVDPDGEIARWLVNNVVKPVANVINAYIVQPIIDFCKAIVAPALMRYGGIDNMVPANHGAMLQARLNAQAPPVSNRLHIYPNSGHYLGDTQPRPDGQHRRPEDQDVHEAFLMDFVAYFDQYMGQPLELDIR